MVIVIVVIENSTKRRTDRICKWAVTTGKIKADFGINSDINVTVGTVVAVADALQKVTTCRHLVWRNTVREWTISYLARATKKPTLSHNNKANFTWKMPSNVVHSHWRVSVKCSTTWEQFWPDAFPTKHKCRPRIHCLDHRAMVTPTWLIIQ